MNLLYKLPNITALCCFLLLPVNSHAADTDLAQQLFDEAIVKRESGDVFSAIKLFQQILNDKPDLNRARLELAVAYHQASLYQDAMREFKTVLDDPETPENVRLSILAYLGQVSSDQKEPEGQHDFSYYLKLGALNNSNLNASQAVSTGLNTVSSARISSIGTDIAVSASHRYRKRDLMNVAGSTTSFEWQSQATMTSNVYAEENDFNLHIASLTTGPAFISPGRWRSSVFIRVDHIVLGSSTLATFVSLNPTITFDLGGFRSVILESSFSTQSYDDTLNAGYEGNTVMLGAGYTTFLQQHGTGLEGGARLSTNNADVDGFAYDLIEVYAGGFKVLDEHSNVYMKINSRSYEYDGIDPNELIVRDESELQFALGYNYDHSSGWLQDWTMNIEFSAIDSDSNANNLDYKRNLVSVNWSRYFQ